MSAVNELVITPEFVTNIIAVDLADETTFTTADKAKLNGIEAGAQVNTVTRVAGKTGVVELDAGDIAYDASETYASGKIGAALKSAQEKLDTIEEGAEVNAVNSVNSKSGDVVLNAGDIGYDGSTTYDTGTVGEKLTHLNRQISESITPAIEEIETALDGKAPVIINTASGDIASFEDGADGMPVKSLVVNIEPVQDLHGYANPWPAGGGKNLYNVDDLNTFNVDGITATIENGKLKLSGTATANAFFTYEVNAPSGDYVWSINNQVGNSNVRVAIQKADKSYALDNNLSQVNKVVTYTGDIWKAILYVSSGATVTNFEIKPQLESGSTPTAWSPYSNICPISGHTGASVTRTGKNLCDSNTGEYDRILNGTGGTGVQAGWWASDYVLLKNGEQYTASFYSTNEDAIICFYDKNKTFLRRYYRNHPNLNLTFVVGTGIAENVVYARLSCKYLSSSNPAAALFIGDTAFDYETGISEAISVNWETEAGTVYGGTLDVTNGVLTVDSVFEEFNGDETFTKITYSAADRYVTTLAQTALLVGNQSQFIAGNYFSVTNQSSAEISAAVISNNRMDLRFPLNMGISTVAQLNNYLSQNPLQVVYTLANPITYQLTPQELDTLLGTNNIWSDVGDTTIEYPADTKLYIDGKIAEAIANALNA